MTPRAASRDEPAVLIVGGGIGGLALALALHQRGWPARVLEAAPSIREMGVGITLLPHAVRELSALGLEPAIAAIAIENRESAFFNRFGQKLFAEPRGRFAGYPFPEYGIHRGKLQGVLHRAVLERLGSDAVVTDCQVTGLVQDATRVKLSCRRSSDGAAREPLSASLVVACDGVNSALRRKFYPNEGVVFTGINTWRGVTRMRPILDGRTYLRVGSIRTGKIVIYPIIDDVDGRGNQLVNWVAEIERPSSKQNDWNRAGDSADVLPIYESFVFDWLDVPRLIREADTIFEYPMVDKDPIERWTFGRVTLLGDAAHPMYPRGSNGSAQALIDARVLADALASMEDPLAALRAYEAQRAPATAAIVRTNRTSPPDVINLKVEELVGDRPFERLDAYISQEELRMLSDQYKHVAGFSSAQLAESTPLGSRS